MQSGAFNRVRVMACDLGRSRRPVVKIPAVLLGPVFGCWGERYCRRRTLKRYQNAAKGFVS
jgi:hypothetical protein